MRLRFVLIQSIRQRSFDLATQNSLFGGVPAHGGRARRPQCQSSTYFRYRAEGSVRDLVEDF
jgi:hypothetical protein